MPFIFYLDTGLYISYSKTGIRMLCAPMTCFIPLIAASSYAVQLLTDSSWYHYI